MMLLATGACVYAPMKGYPGAVLPAGQTAIVRSGPYTDLVSADGVKVPDLSVALLPGEHTIGMELSQQQQPYYLGSYLFSSPFPGLVTFTAAPGHEYLAYIDFQGQPAPGYEEYSGWSWTGYIKDEATRARVGKTETLPLTAFPLVPYQGGGGYSAR